MDPNQPTGGNEDVTQGASTRRILTSEVWNDFEECKGPNGQDEAQSCLYPLMKANQSFLVWNEVQPLETSPKVPQCNHKNQSYAYVPFSQNPDDSSLD